MKPQKRKNKLATLIGAVSILLIGGVIAYSMFVLTGGGGVQVNTQKSSNTTAKTVAPGTHDEVQAIVSSRFKEQSAEYKKAVDAIAKEATSINRERTQIEGMYDASRF